MRAAAAAAQPAAQHPRLATHRPLPPLPPQVNLKYLKKSARDEAKAALKQQYKAAKRAKLDPEQVGDGLPSSGTRDKASEAAACRTVGTACPPVESRRCPLSPCGDPQLSPLTPPSQAKGTVQLQREAAERAKQQQQNGVAHSDVSEEGDSGDDSGSEDEGRGQQHHQPQRPGRPQGTVGQLAIPKGALGAQTPPGAAAQCGPPALCTLLCQARTACSGASGVMAPCARVLCRQAAQPRGAAAAPAGKAGGERPCDVWWTVSWTADAGIDRCCGRSCRLLHGARSQVPNGVLGATASR